MGARAVAQQGCRMMCIKWNHCFFLLLHLSHPFFSYSNSRWGLLLTRRVVFATMEKSCPRYNSLKMCWLTEHSRCNIKPTSSSASTQFDSTCKVDRLRLLRNCLKTHHGNQWMCNIEKFEAPFIFWFFTVDVFVTLFQFAPLGWILIDDFNDCHSFIPPGARSWTKLLKWSRRRPNFRSRKSHLNEAPNTKEAHSIKITKESRVIRS